MNLKEMFGTVTVQPNTLTGIDATTFTTTPIWDVEIREMGRKIERLERLLDEKERHINILMEVLQAQLGKKEANGRTDS